MHYFGPRQGASLCYCHTRVVISVPLVLCCLLIHQSTWLVIISQPLISPNDTLELKVPTSRLRHHMNCMDGSTFQSLLGLWVLHSIPIFSVIHYLDLHGTIFLIIRVIFYQIKLSMTNIVQTTNLTKFLVQYEICNK
jgi:hypothetical protein